MTNFNKVDLLEIVEYWADSENLISSEEELSERFDSDILPLIIEQCGEDDEPAINEGFNDWSDSLCKDGELHEEQYNNYCYVGRLSEEG